MGWNIFLMKTSQTLRRGFGSMTKVIIDICPPYAPGAVPLYHAASECGASCCVVWGAGDVDGDGDGRVVVSRW